MYMLSIRSASCSRWEGRGVHRDLRMLHMVVGAALGRGEGRGEDMEEGRGEDRVEGMVRTPRRAVGSGRWPEEGQA